MSTSFFGPPAKPKAAKVTPKKVANIAPVTADTAERRAAAAKAGTPSYGVSQGAIAPTSPTPPTPPVVDNGTGEVNYGSQTLDNPAPAPIADTSIETLVKTPEYMARERALAAAMELFGESQNLEKARYGTNYKQSLEELGYDPTKASFDLGQLIAQGERATTSGKAYNALRNDFAARGMLQSGAYQAQRGVLTSQLEKQRQAIDEANVNFGVDQANKLKAQQAANEAARQQALAEAKQAVLERFAMGA